jgi:DNA-binding protein
MYQIHEKNHDAILIGTKPIMTYVNAILTLLSTQQMATIKARGRRIIDAIDVSQIIVKKMNAVGYRIKDVRISCDVLSYQDGKTRNVSTMEIDIQKNSIEDIKLEKWRIGRKNFP